MDPKKILSSSKEFVADHRVAIAVTATAATTAVLVGKLRGRALRELYEFLDEKNLQDEFNDFITKNAGV